MNIKRSFEIILLAIVLFQVGCANSSQEWQEIEKAHVITDLSHEFSFYADHRFDRQYRPGQKGVTN